MANNFNEFLTVVNKGNQMNLSNTIKRTNGIPLDFSSVQESYEAAFEYAKNNPLAYIGQPISVGDILYVVTTAENGYLKQVGVKPVGDEKSIEVSEEGVVSIYGFEAAGEATLPRKNSDGSISWITLADIAGSTDTNTKTVVAVAEDSAITVNYSYNEETDTRTYTLDVQLPAIPEYSVEKVDSEGEVTYKVTKDGVQVGESIVVPNAFDPSEILESIETLQGYFTEGEANVAVEAKGYVANGAIDAEFKRLAGLIDGLAGVDTTFTQDLKDLKDSFDAFMEGSGVENVIDSLADIKAAIEELQNHATVYEAKVDQNVEDINAIKGRLDVVEAIEHHEHENKAELDKIAEGDIEKWNSLVNYDDSEVRGLIEPKADKSYVDEELIKKVNVEGYVAYSQEEKEKLAGLENYNDAELVAKVGSLENKFTEGAANDAAKLGGQLPEYYASQASVAEAIAGVHSHENKDILDNISSTQVAAWDAAEQNAKTFAEAQALDAKNAAIADAEAKLAGAKSELSASIASEVSRAQEVESGFADRLDILEAKEATKVEDSETNGNIKVDGEEIQVYNDSELSARVSSLESSSATKEELKAKVDSATLEENYYSKGQTEEKITEMIGVINGGQSAGEVLASLNAYKTLNDDRVKAVEDKNSEQDVSIAAAQAAADAAQADIDAFLAAADTTEKAIDTLKEIQTYIESDGAAAAQLTERVAANEGAITSEVSRAKAKEDELAALINNIDSAYQAKDVELAGLISSLQEEDERLAGLISANESAIAGISSQISNAIAGIPAATAEALGLVKIGNTMSIDEAGVLNVAKVSTDILVQGELELILNGGTSAK